MSFYFCGKYIYVDCDDKEVEQSMFAAIPYFWVLTTVMVMKWERYLEGFFSYFDLTSNQKCLYTQKKLDEEAYWWWKDSYSSYRCWFVLQDLLRARYAPHLFFPEFRETLEGIRKGIEEYMAAKVDTETELELEAAAASEPAVVVGQSWNQKLQLSQSEQLSMSQS